MSSILAKSPLGMVDTPCAWGWIRYRLTRWTRQGKDGQWEKQYIGVLRANNDPRGYTQMEVLFWSRQPTKVLRAACSVPRTTDEMLQFFKDYQ